MDIWQKAGAGRVRRCVVIVVAAVSATWTVSAAPAAAAKTREEPSTLRAGGRMHGGDVRVSRDGRYRLVMQNDGNLVLYRVGRASGSRHAVWSSQTDGNRGAVAVMQHDANFVVYSRSKRPLYATGTTTSDGRATPARLVVRDDGALVVLRGPDDRRVWSSALDGQGLTAGQILRAGQSRESANGRYRLAMQVDGNLVLYGPAARALWSSQTRGNTGAWTAMQSDGNLVVYAANGEPLYVSATVGDRGTRLAVQDDGNLVISSSAGTPLWGSAQDVYTLRAGQRLRPGQWRQSPNGRYAMTMQTDGNLVLVDLATNTALWGSQTAGNPGASAGLQPDGNLVVYSQERVALFATGTQGDAATRLLIQDDGNAVIYNGAGVPLWSWRAGRV